jgi:hypothetical protein
MLARNQVPGAVQLAQPRVADRSPDQGVSGAEYEARADPWPLNPNGELLLGVKEEDKYAVAKRGRESEDSRLGLR